MHEPSVDGNSSYGHINMFFIALIPDEMPALATYCAAIAHGEPLFMEKWLLSRGLIVCFSFALLAI